MGKKIIVTSLVFWLFLILACSLVSAASLTDTLHITRETGTGDAYIDYTPWPPGRDIDAWPLFIEGGTPEKPKNTIVGIRAYGSGSEQEILFSSGNTFDDMNGAVYVNGEQKEIRLKAFGGTLAEFLIRNSNLDAQAMVVSRSERVASIGFATEPRWYPVETASIYRPANSEDLIINLASQGDIMTFSATNGNVGIRKPDPDFELDVDGEVNASDGYSSISDVKFKNDIKAIDAPLNKIQNIKGVSFKWKTAQYQNKSFSKGEHYGVIGQEIEKVLPEIVKENSNGEKSVVYLELIPILIEAMKEQQATISRLSEKVTELEKELMLKGNIAMADTNLH
jgi:hypothetical protein